MRTWSTLTAKLPRAASVHSKKRKTAIRTCSMLFYSACCAAFFEFRFFFFKSFFFILISIVIAGASPCVVGPAGAKLFTHQGQLNRMVHVRNPK